MSKLIKSNQPCRDCGSSDAGAYYDNSEEGRDNTFYCYSCQTTYYTTTNFKGMSTEDNLKELQEEEEFMFIDDYPIKALESRGLTLDTCKHFNVHSSYNESTGELEAYYFPFYDKDGSLVSWKEKTIEPKRYKWHNKRDNVGLFGQQKVGTQGFLVLHEGLEDAMAGYQMLKKLGKNYQVLGLPDGVTSVKQHIEYLSGFSKIILMFDSDEPGIKGARKASNYFANGQVKVASLTGYKDVNQCLLEGKPEEYLSAINNAKLLTPSGIISASDSWDRLFEDDGMSSIPYPYQGLNEKLYGITRPSLITVISGTGMGKSAFLRELQYYLITSTDTKIGILALEESVQHTLWSLIGLDAEKPLHIPEVREDYSNDKIKEHFKKLYEGDKVYCYDHFGGSETEEILKKIRYMVKVLGVSHIFLDHISIIISALSDGDERRTLDNFVTELRTLIQETGCTVFAVNHLRRLSKDKGHEDGQEVLLNHIRGSQALAQLSDTVIGLQRDGKNKDEVKANTTEVVVLKNRKSGNVGSACHLYYDKETGRLSEVHPEEDEDNFEF